MKALFQLFVVFYWEWISLLIWRTPLVFFSSESTSHFGCFIIERNDTWKFKRSSKWVAYSFFNKCIGIQLLESVAITLISQFRVCEKCFKRWLFVCLFFILIRNLFTWYWFKLYHWAAFWMYILKKEKRKVIDGFIATIGLQMLRLLTLQWWIFICLFLPCEYVCRNSYCITLLSQITSICKKV